MMVQAEQKNSIPGWIHSELDRICTVIDRNMQRFGEKFPSACAENGVYRVTENEDWTNGFWTGMLWIAYEYSGDQRFRTGAEKHLESFEDRLRKNIVLDHHDIGFLYSLSAGGAYRILKDPRWGELLVQAAKVLSGRFREKGGFLQAWGSERTKEEYRMIIDSLMNLPILYRAGEISGESKYRRIADTHYDRVLSYIIRKDYTTYHTFYFDPETGKPDRGVTHQGYSDDSCWSRGQAWALLGIPLNMRVSGKTPGDRETRILDGLEQYFCAHLPSDGIPCWDLVFGERSGEPRDSSALAIAACAMMERNKKERAVQMLQSLYEHASTVLEEDPWGILLHGTYSCREGKGVNEPNLWGDYFYMEALYRIWRPAWKPYW